MNDEYTEIYTLGKVHFSCKVNPPDWFKSEKHKYFYIKGRMDEAYKENLDEDIETRIKKINESWESS